MEKIETLLEEDEKILWKRSSNRNLLAFIPFGIGGAIIVNIVFAFTGYLIYDTLESVFFLGCWIVFVIIFDGYCFIWFMIHAYSNMKKHLQLTSKELKNYEEYEVITNMRYIRRNYFLNFDKNFLSYSKRSIERINDITFLDLNRIQEIWVSHKIGKIFLRVNIHKGDTNFYIKFQNDEANEIIKALTEVRKDIPIYGEEKFIIERD
ncbi:MAG: hypothetical protein ACFFDN_15315 [Candidatus Hodarchaeota archaeon]